MRVKTHAHHNVMHGCQRSFQLKDEMAGRKVRCPECEAIQVVPAPGPEEVGLRLEPGNVAGRLHPAFNRDRFLLRQKLIDHQREIRRLG